MCMYYICTTNARFRDVKHQSQGINTELNTTHKLSKTNGRTDGQTNRQCKDINGQRTTSIIYYEFTWPLLFEKYADSALCGHHVGN